jgi:hypothetical protein
MEGTQLPDFTGKVLVVRLTHRDAGVTNVVAKARLENQAGRLFLVGEIVDDPSQKTQFAGRTNAIAWDQVAEYIVLNSVEEYHHHLKSGRTLGWLR